MTTTIGAERRTIARPARGFRGGLVPRDRIVSRLHGASEVPIGLLVAPAGYGKTTVLLQWDAADQRPFVWFTLEERHSDPVRLIGSIARGLAEVGPIDDGVFTALSAPRPNISGVVIPRLCESLLAGTDPVVLVLDDVHMVLARDALQPLTRIARSLPAGSMLVLASRDEPALPLARLRANHQLIEIRAGDLVMTGSEGALLLEAAGLEIRAETAARLVERTEGWPAGLYLAALALDGSDDPEGAAEEFAGDDRLVADYLRDEFVSALPSDEFAFLVRTSVLDRLSGPLCDAVLERDDSGEMLLRLSRSNLLLVPLDRRDRLFRYHALLREMLQAELHRGRSGEERELHARASAWYAERAGFDRAVPHAIAAGDVERAGDLIWGRAASYSSAGLESTLQHWLDAFTEEQIASVPTLCLALATCRLSQGDGAQVEQWTATALRLLADGDRDDREALALAARAIKASGAATEGVVRMRADSARAYAGLPDDSPWRSLCRFTEGVGYHLAGDRPRARKALEEGARRGAASAPHIQTLCLAQLALLALDEGDLDGASGLAERSLETADRCGLNEYPTSALLFAVGALVRARQGRAADARGDVKRASVLLETLSDLSPWYEAESRVALGRALALLDDIPGARAQLADAGRFTAQVPDAPVLADWSRLAWREADPATAVERWPLTPAELRLLHFMPTHLSFREIAEQLVVSANTVKTQAQAIYRKLGVSSRAEAVACAEAAGLIEHREVPSRADG
jgi:LuxR family transcriptional regulator, maltose regulon positive regulatory protein